MTDTEILDWLEMFVNKYTGLLLHDGTLEGSGNKGYAIGLHTGRQTLSLREAIISRAARCPPAERHGKVPGDSEIVEGLEAFVNEHGPLLISVAPDGVYWKEYLAMPVSPALPKRTLREAIAGCVGLESNFPKYAPRETTKGEANA